MCCHLTAFFLGVLLNPKNPWTLQWKGLNLYSKGPGSQHSHFWGVRILREGHLGTQSSLGKPQKLLIYQEKYNPKSCGPKVIRSPSPAGRRAILPWEASPFRAMCSILFSKPYYPSRIEWDLTNGPLRKLLELPRFRGPCWRFLGY